MTCDLEDNSFSGTLPTEIGELTALSEWTLFV